MKQKKQQRGSITLETAIMLPIFFFMFMAIIGLLRVVATQNMMTHTLIQATKSLSLDTYLVNNISDGDVLGIKNLAGGILAVGSIGGEQAMDGTFASNERWYDGDGSSAVKDRFVGYLTGGDEAAAGDKLKTMGVVNGLDGVTFTYVSQQDDDFSITIDYEIQYWFDWCGMGKLPMEQTIYSRFWQK